MGRHDDALAVFAELLRNDPADGWIRYQVGLVRWARGDRDAAGTEFAAALEIERAAAEANAGDSWRAFNVAVFLAARGRHEEALAQLRTALDGKHDADDVQAAVEDFAELHRVTGCDVDAALATLRADGPSGGGVPRARVDGP
nr:hypothetical protein [Amycolatopsis australiensis]